MDLLIFSRKKKKRETVINKKKTYVSRHEGYRVVNIFK